MSGGSQTTFCPPGPSLALWQMSIWYRPAWTITIKATVDGLICALLTAAVFGWLWPLWPPHPPLWWTARPLPHDSRLKPEAAVLAVADFTCVAPFVTTLALPSG